MTTTDDNARLYAETRRADELQTLFVVQQAITRRLDLEAMLQLIADEARRLCGAQQSALSKVEGEDFVVSVLSGEVHGLGVGRRFPIKHSLLGLALETGQILVSDDAPNDPRVDAGSVRSGKIQTLIAAPLILEGQPFGGITVANKVDGQFNDDDKRLLEMLASSAVLGIENARLHEAERARWHEAEQRRQVAEGLRDILATLNSNRSPKEILQHIVGQACRLLHADAVALLQVDDTNKNLLTLQASSGLPIEHFPGLSVQVNDNVVGQAVSERRPIFIPDTQVFMRDEPNWSTRERTVYTYLTEHYSSTLAVPLIVKGEAFGCFTLYYLQQRELGSDEVGLAMAFSDQAAMAIENARLRAQAEQAAASAERSRLARELHDAVTQTLFSASLIAEILPRLWQENPPEGERKTADLRRLTRGALAEMRALLLELRPAGLVETPLGDLLRHLVEGITGRSRLAVSLTINGQGRLFTPDAQIALYRIAQEALNNIMKHAKADTIEVHLHYLAGAVELRVIDNGRGFDIANVPHDHFGLSIMRERAESIGAQIRIDSRPDQGTRIRVFWSEAQQGE